MPVGLTAFTEELLLFPRVALTDTYMNIVQYSDMPRGGHFAAFEEPELVEQDLRKFIRAIGQQQK